MYFKAIITIVFLAEAVAFSLSPFEWTTQIEKNQLTVTAKIATGHYFYADSLNLVVKEKDGKKLIPSVKPLSVLHQDEVLGQVDIYPAGIHVWKFIGSPPFDVTVDFQGCRDKTASDPALCFMPQSINLLSQTSITEKPENSLLVALPKLADFKLTRKVIGLQNIPQFKAFLTGIASNKANFCNLGINNGLIWIILLTILGGLGLNLTPCVLPIIPVNLAIIGANGNDKIVSFWRSFAYGAGIALTYGILGITVILTGASFGNINSSCWFNFSIAAILVVLSLAMFGFFNLDFSGKIKIKPSQIRGSKITIALIMGSLSALMAGACVTPVIVTVLILAAERYQNGNIFALGLPFLLGIGMALPWPLAGVGLSVLPKPGKFMVVIKNLFGIVILMMAFYYLQIGYQLIPGKYSPEKEIARLNTALTKAQEQGKPVLIDFWSSWCKNCKSMEKTVLNDPIIKKEMENFVVIKFQAENLDTPIIDSIMKYWEIPGLPAFVILSPK